MDQEESQPFIQPAAKKGLKKGVKKRAKKDPLFVDKNGVPLKIGDFVSWPNGIGHITELGKKTATINSILQTYWPDYASEPHDITEKKRIRYAVIEKENK